MEECDIAVVGAGVAGLAAAVALRQVNPRWRIKVMDSRPAPAGKYGGACRLQPNGLKAAAAISAPLASACVRLGLREKVRGSGAHETSDAEPPCSPVCRAEAAV